MDKASRRKEKYLIDIIYILNVAANIP